MDVKTSGRNSRSLRIFVFAIAALAVLYTIFNLRKDGSSEGLPILDKISNAIVTPTPMPFLEMTVPYLRSREFESELSGIKQAADRANYTSYVASYNSEGSKVNGLLTVPKGDKPDGGFPGIIFVHGYIPPETYQTTDNYEDYVDYLARNSFVVYKIDLRGHGDSEGEAGGGYYAADYVIDTLNAKAALEASEFASDLGRLVNPDKIGLWGHSMAGNITLRSFVAQQNIKALVVWAGAGFTYNDLREYGIDDNSYRPPQSDSERQRRRQALREAHGDFDPESEFWKQVTPVNYLDGVTGALQLHHATDDNVVSVEYSRNLIKVLEGTNIEHELYEYQSGGYNISGNSFSLAMQRTVEFFKSNL